MAQTRVLQRLDLKAHMQLVHFSSVRTLGELRALLEGFPDSTPIRGYSVEDPEYVVIVDSKGNAQRVVTKTERTMTFYLKFPISS